MLDALDPVCYACGRYVAHLYEPCAAAIARGLAPHEILDHLGLRTICCRRMFLAIDPRPLSSSECEGLHCRRDAAGGGDESIASAALSDHTRLRALALYACHGNMLARSQVDSMRAFAGRVHHDLQGHTGTVEFSSITADRASPDVIGLADEGMSSVLHWYATVHVHGYVVGVERVKLFETPAIAEASATALAGTFRIDGAEHTTVMQETAAHNTWVISNMAQQTAPPTPMGLMLESRTAPAYVGATVTFLARARCTSAHPKSTATISLYLATRHLGEPPVVTLSAPGVPLGTPLEVVLELLGCDAGATVAGFGLIRAPTVAMDAAHRARYEELTPPWLVDASCARPHALQWMLTQYTAVRGCAPRVRDDVCVGGGSSRLEERYPEFASLAGDKQRVLQAIVTQWVLPHVSVPASSSSTTADGRQSAAMLLLRTTHQLLLASAGVRPFDNMDAFENKRVLTIGMLLEQYTWPTIFARVVAGWAVIAAEAEAAATGDNARIAEPTHLRAPFETAGALHVTTPLMRAVKMGQFGRLRSPSGAPRFTQRLDMANRAAMISHVRRVEQLTSSSGGGHARMPEARREFTGTRVGRFCKDTTPANDHVGMTGELALTAFVTARHHHTGASLARQLCDRAGLEVAPCSSGIGVSIWSDGVWSCVARPPSPSSPTSAVASVASALRVARRTGACLADVGIYADVYAGAVLLSTAPGRVCRPLFVARASSVDCALADTAQWAARLIGLDGLDGFDAHARPVVRPIHVISRGDQRSFVESIRYVERIQRLDEGLKIVIDVTVNKRQRLKLGSGTSNDRAGNLTVAFAFGGISRDRFVRRFAVGFEHALLVA